jgi:hypothetical protein
VTCENCKRVAHVVDGLVEEVARTRRNLESKGKGGMRVPFQGDFANAPPSTVIKLEWWLRELQEALTAPTLKEKP